MPSQLERDVRRFRRGLLRGERSVIETLTDVYGRAWQRIQDDVDELLEQIASARAAGQTVDASWLRQQARYESLQRQIETEVDRYARIAASHIDQSRAAAVRGGSQESAQLIQTAMGRVPPGVNVMFNRLPASAVETLVGSLRRTTPLGQLLDELGSETAQAISDALIDGLTKGRHPRRIARDIRRAGHMPLREAERLARTEILRAYRMSSLETYRANSHLLEGWIWFAELDDRTCVGCWMQHGTLHSFDDDLHDHPNGRCTRLPLTKSWEALGYSGIPDTRPRIETGKARFERLSDERKATILGPAKWQAYRNGDLTLDDLVGVHSDPTWGRSIQERSLKSIVGLERSEEIIAGIRAG